MCRSPVNEPGNSVSSDHVSPASLEVIISELSRREFSRIRAHSCFPSGDLKTQGSSGSAPSISPPLRSSCHVTPPSVEMLCQIVSGGRSAPSRRHQTYNARWRFPVMGTIVMGATTQCNPFGSNGVHVTPLSCDTAWRMSPLPSMTNSRSTPSASVSRCRHGQFLAVFQLSGTDRRSDQVKPPSVLFLSTADGPP